MKNLDFLNKKEINTLLNKIKEQYGIKELNLDHIFLRNKEDKIFIISKNIKKADLNKLRINSIGLYFCKIEKNVIRLSIEGSQLIGNLANKNIISLDKKELKEWLIGNNIEINSRYQGYVIIKSENDYFGTGFIKNKLLINYLPKPRRLKVINE